MPNLRRRRAERLPRYESPLYVELLARIAGNLRRLREAKGWTQQEAGDACGGMTMQQYQRIEGGQTNLTFTTLARVADGLGVDPHDLLAPLHQSEKEAGSA